MGLDKWTVVKVGPGRWTYEDFIWDFTVRAHAVTFFNTCSRQNFGAKSKVTL